MIAGRKLLIAADTPYYRKVIGLTFKDEGMEVTTVGDGREAWESLEQSVPDVILADVFMPEVSGYELCELIKQSERFGRIPVMLLVGLYEPFDEAEARRVGADDVVTKPFQSIRQLVSRVGSLLGGKAGDEEDAAHEYSTLGLGHSDTAASAHDDQAMPEPNVPVFVEAASMTETVATDSGEPAENTCAADIGLQTANTMEMEGIDDEPPAPIVAAITYAQDDTVEMRPVADEREDSSAEPSLEEAPEEAQEQPVAMSAPEVSEQSSQQVTPAHGSAVFDDELLDLGAFDTTPRAIAEDVILDLGYEEPVREPIGEPLSEPLSELDATAAAPIVESAVVFESVSAEVIVAEPAYEDVTVAEIQEWAVVTPLETTEAPIETPEAPVETTETPVAAVTPVSVVEAEQTAANANLELSPETIDAIARRTVEHLSEKVVREIAWEVVPELAELLIKKKLEEQK